MKSNEDKFDVDKLIPVSVDLSKVSDAIENDIAEKVAYNVKSKMLKIKYLMLLT